MAVVILVLGLVAAGVYTGSWGFYLAAIIAGMIYMLLAAIIASATATISKSATNLQKKENPQQEMRDRLHEMKNRRFR